MANLNHLADYLGRLDKEIGEKVSKVVQTVAVTITQNVATFTPVDTSNAISNWTVQIDSPTNAVIGPHYLGRYGSTYSESLGETIMRAKLAVKSHTRNHAIYISNNVHYIRKLNAGSSRQQPAGFVERAVLIGRQKAIDEGAKLKLRKM